MKRAQIKELAQSIVFSGELSENDLNWILKNLSRNDLKMFVRLLTQEVNDRKVVASFAGNLGDEEKNKIISLFPDKNIEFKRDDEGLGAGLKLEYSDFVLDYSVSGIIKRILSSIRESL